MARQTSSNRPTDFAFRHSLPAVGDRSPVRRKRQMFARNRAGLSLTDPYETGYSFDWEDFCLTVGADPTLLPDELYEQRGGGVDHWDAELYMARLRGEVPDPKRDEEAEAWLSPEPPQHLTRRPPQESLLNALERVRNGRPRRIVSHFDPTPRLVKTTKPVVGPLPPAQADSSRAKSNQARRTKRRIPRKAQKHARLVLGKY
jgi:hypothetical protein